MNGTEKSLCCVIVIIKEHFLIKCNQAEWFHMSMYKEVLQTVVAFPVFDKFSRSQNVNDEYENEIDRFNGQKEEMKRKVYESNEFNVKQYL